MSAEKQQQKKKKGGSSSSSSTKSISTFSFRSDASLEDYDKIDEDISKYISQEDEVEKLKEKEAKKLEAKKRKRDDGDGEKKKKKKKKKIDQQQDDDQPIINNDDDHHQDHQPIIDHIEPEKRAFTIAKILKSMGIFESLKDERFNSNNESFGKICDAIANQIEKSKVYTIFDRIRPFFLLHNEKYIKNSPQLKKRKNLTLRAMMHILGRVPLDILYKSEIPEHIRVEHNVDSFQTIKFIWENYKKIPNLCDPLLNYFKCLQILTVEGILRPETIEILSNFITYLIDHANLKNIIRSSNLEFLGEDVNSVPIIDKVIDEVIDIKKKNNDDDDDYDYDQKLELDHDDEEDNDYNYNQNFGENYLDSLDDDERLKNLPNYLSDITLGSSGFLKFNFGLDIDDSNNHQRSALNERQYYMDDIQSDTEIARKNVLKLMKHVLDTKDIQLLSKIIRKCDDNPENLKIILFSLFDAAGTQEEPPMAIAATNTNTNSNQNEILTKLEEVLKSFEQLRTIPAIISDISLELKTRKGNHLNLEIIDSELENSNAKEHELDNLKNTLSSHLIGRILNFPLITRFLKSIPQNRLITFEGVTVGKFKGIHDDDDDQNQEDILEEEDLNEEEDQDQDLNDNDQDDQEVFEYSSIDDRNNLTEMFNKKLTKSLKNYNQVRQTYMAENFKVINITNQILFGKANQYFRVGSAEAIQKISTKLNKLDSHMRNFLNTSFDKSFDVFNSRFNNFFNQEIEFENADKINLQLNDSTDFYSMCIIFALIELALTGIRIEEQDQLTSIVNGVGSTFEKYTANTLLKKRFENSSSKSKNNVSSIFTKTLNRNGDNNNRNGDDDSIIYPRFEFKFINDSQFLEDLNEIFDKHIGNLATFSSFVTKRFKDDMITEYRITQTKKENNDDDYDHDDDNYKQKKSMLPNLFKKQRSRGGSSSNFSMFFKNYQDKKLLEDNEKKIKEDTLRRTGGGNSNNSKDLLNSLKLF